jgi:hypothetical protein
MTNVALFFHLVGAFLFVSGAVVAAAAFEVARRRDDLQEIALLLGVTRVGVVLVGAGGALVLAFGLWLVHLTRAGYGATWVDSALGLFALAAALGALGGRRPRHARLLARGGGPAAEVRALLDDRWSRAANCASAAVVLAILALMVWQPS